MLASLILLSTTVELAERWHSRPFGERLQSPFFHSGHGRGQTVLRIFTVLRPLPVGDLARFMLSAATFGLFFDKDLSKTGPGWNQNALAWKARFLRWCGAVFMLS